MKKIKQIIKENNLTIDIINVIIGIGVVVSLVLFCMFPGNLATLAFLCGMAGIMNVSNGVRQYRDKKRRSIGLCMIVLGVLILVGGIYLVRLILI